MLDSRVLGIGLDTRERSLGTRALHLELGYEDGGIATDALRIDHRSLVREEPEAREVLDVVRAEEDVAGQALAPDVLEQSLAPLLQLGGGDAGVGLGALRHHLLLGRHGSGHSRRSLRGYPSVSYRHRPSWWCPAALRSRSRYARLTRRPSRAGRSQESRWHPRSGLRSGSLKRASSSACRSASRPFAAAASNAFMVGP